MMEPTPVYICTGFLDSGKTLLVKDTLMEQEWIEPGLTLLILCEEGEEEYSKEYLEENDMVLLKIDKFEQLNAAFFTNCEKNYHPAQVVIEYNGMWKLEDLLQLKYPRKWQIQGIYSTVNGTTLDMYLKNMRNMLMEQLTESELIIINRCPEGVDRSGFRRALKVQNPMAQLIFEGMDGKIIQPTAEDLPFDIKENPIKVEDEDFGIWYVDAYDHPDQYMDKEIEFAILLSRISRSEKISSRLIVSISLSGSILPSTCTILLFSKQRTTCTIASTSRIFARNWFPSPSPFDAPFTSPAISTNSIAAGMIFFV